VQQDPGRVIAGAIIIGTIGIIGTLLAWGFTRPGPKRLRGSQVLLGLLTLICWGFGFLWLGWLYSLTWPGPGGGYRSHDEAVAGTVGMSVLFFGALAGRYGLPALLRRFGWRWVSLGALAALVFSCFWIAAGNHESASDLMTRDQWQLVGGAIAAGAGACAWRWRDHLGRRTPRDAQ
jgi:hypothetical protein